MKAALALALLLGTRAASAAPARWHFTFGKWSLSILFERKAGEGDATRLLVAAPAGRFVFLSSQNPSGRDSMESIRRVTDGETLSRRLVLSSFEEIPACSPVRAPDACLVFTGAGGAVVSGLGAFAGTQAAPLREKVAALVSPGMRDALFALAPILPAVAEFGSYGKDFLGLVWPDRFAKPMDLRKGERRPGCAFDATFGFPCSDVEKAREAKRFAEPAR
ncbi:MAG TPA: hypothetical protein VMV60_17060 [Thermoanaerobaculia bacterium]|nr:hypothetical protein [Thermoanaerobaculia bacterium]